tara:strand:+ start:342 stop:653 length:312 start_codon:yes stop_codon:yes gene_type:complete
MPKKLQPKSQYAEYDTDGDGIVSDEELSHVKEIKQTEDATRKNLAQLRMARFSLIAMGAFTLAMFFIPIERVAALSDISNLFYLTGGGIVAAYMGTTAWVQKK